MRNKLYKILAVSIGLALAFTFSCSSDGDNDDGGNNPSGGGSEGRLITLAIKDIISTSFTAVENDPRCETDGTLRDEIYEYPTSYIISGSTLSFGDAIFSGNSASLIGTWNSSNLQRIEFKGNIGSYGISGVSKAVFTQNSITLTQCTGGTYKNGAAVKVIDCGTAEITKGNETVKYVASGAWRTFTYNGKTCKSGGGYSEAQMQTACTQAYNKATADGGYTYDYYYDILEKEYRDCVKDFPEWF